MENNQNPELHINEEPRNDFLDTGVGFLAMFGFMLVFGVLFTVLEVVLR